LPQTILACRVSPHRIDAVGADQSKIEVSIDSADAGDTTRDDTSLAFYELQNCAGEQRYCFWGSTCPLTQPSGRLSSRWPRFSFQNSFRR
jgi:hypothetical protein